MQKEQVLSILQAHKDEICQRFGVRHLAVFGSTARAESHDNSDVDVLVDYDGPATSDQYFGLLFFLEDTLGCPIDLVTEQALRKELRPYVERDAVYVA